MIIGTQASATIISSQYLTNDLVNDGDHNYAIALSDTDQANLQSDVEWATLTFYFKDDQDGFSLLHISQAWHYNHHSDQYQKSDFDFRIDNEKEYVQLNLGEHTVEHESHSRLKLSVSSEEKPVGDQMATAYQIELVKGFVADFSEQIALTSRDINNFFTTGVMSFGLSVVGDLYLEGLELSYQFKDNTYAAPEPSSLILITLSLLGIGITHLVRKSRSTHR